MWGQSRTAYEAGRLLRFLGAASAVHCTIGEELVGGSNAERRKELMSRELTK